MEIKSPKIFISHSSKDEKIVSAFVDLLFDIGLNTGQIFCTSVPGCGVLIDNDIYTSLKREFEEHQVHVVFMLSSNYYGSPACLNEMGLHGFYKQHTQVFCCLVLSLERLRERSTPVKWQ